MPKQDFIDAQKPDLNLIKDYLDTQDEIILKVVKSDIKHRTENKLVDTHISSLDKAKQFLQRVSSLVDSYEDVVIQEKIESGIEVIIGMLRDSNFGSTMVVGSGGIYTEIWKDVTYLPSPTSDKAILESLTKTRIGKVLSGYRNQIFDIQSLAKQVYGLSQLAETFTQIQSFEINPIIVTKDKATIVDFKIKLHSI
jgi:succinyl-CoA synthetase beta subunit